MIVSPSSAWLEGVLPRDPAQVPRDGGVLTVRAISEPAGLNALQDAFRDGWTLRITKGLIMESLLTIDPLDATLRPGLAHAWESTPEAGTSVFHLRPGVTFSDGRPLTAADVVATFEAVLDPARPTGALRGELSGLKRCEALDEHTVRLTWSSRSPFTFRAAARVPITSAAQLEGDWAELAARPVGTGPFVVSAWARGESLTLTRRPGGAAHLDSIVIRFVKDHTAAATLLERGELDLMTNVQPALWRAMERDPALAWARRYNRIRNTDNSFSYVAWNHRHPALGDVAVRRALAMLYDRALVSQVVDLGLEIPTGCPYLVGSDSCADAGLPFDPPGALAVLADGGWTDSDGDRVLDRDGVALRFTFLVPGPSVRLGKLVPLLQERLKPAGIDMQIERVETTSLSARTARRDFDAVSRVWTEFDKEQDLYPLFHSSQRDGGANISGYASAGVDRLLEAIRAELDPERRHELERQLHRRLVEDQPWLIMTARQSLDLAKPRVHGLVPSWAWYDLTKVWVDPPPRQDP